MRLGNQDNNDIVRTFGSAITRQILAATLAVMNVCAPVVADTQAPSQTGVTENKVPVLKAGISENVSPIASDGSKNVVPAGTSIPVTMIVNLNSELSKVGDEVVAMVATDVNRDGKVVLPGQWLVHGTVTESAHRRKLGRDGYLTVKFDKLFSPDQKYVIPLDAEASTKESTVKSISKVVAKDSVYVSKGAVAGAFTSVQLTGIPLAVATEGYSVAGGAALGALIGLIGALNRKGKIATGFRGEELKFNLGKSIELPAFNAQALPSAAPIHKVDHLDIVIQKASFLPDPYGAKDFRLLRLNFKVANNTDRAYSFSNFVVVSDHNCMYYPYGLSLDVSHERSKTVQPNTSDAGTITFSVDSPKRKYWLVLLDRGNREELTRVPVN